MSLRSREDGLKQSLVVVRRKTVEASGLWQDQARYEALDESV